MQYSKPSLKRIGSAVTLLWLLAGCQWLKDDASPQAGTPVARVYDTYLYRDDLKEVVPDGLSVEDSLRFVQDYLRVWAQDQLMVYKADLNLTSQQKDFEEQIAKYRNDLLKFAYQQKYVNSRLDTQLSWNDLQSYFQEHRQEFILKEDVFQLYFVVLPNNAPQIDDAVAWFKKPTDENRVKLREYALKYALRFNLEDTAWFDFGQIQSFLGMPSLRREDYENWQNQEVIRETTQIVLVGKLAHLPKGAKAPLTHVTGVVRNILLNRRRLALLDELEESLLDDAIKNNEFEKY